LFVQAFSLSSSHYSSALVLVGMDSPEKHSVFLLGKVVSMEVWWYYWVFFSWNWISSPSTDVCKKGFQ